MCYALGSQMSLHCIHQYLHTREFQARMKANIEGEYIHDLARTITL